MKHINFLVCLLLIAIIPFSACKKDKEEEDPKQTQLFLEMETNSDGTYSKIFYNSENKVVKVEEHGDEVITINFTYENNKLKLIEYLVGNDVNSKLEYIYDGSDAPSKVELYTSDFGALMKLGFFELTYTNDKLTKQKLVLTLLGAETDLMYTTFTYNGNNVVKTEDYEIADQNPSLTSSTTYEYDTKKNPYLNDGLNYMIGEVRYISNNNITKETLSDSKGNIDNNESANITYEYNSQNYPIKRVRETLENTKTETTFNYTEKTI